MEKNSSNYHKKDSSQGFCYQSHISPPTVAIWVQLSIVFSFLIIEVYLVLDANFVTSFNTNIIPIYITI